MAVAPPVSAVLAGTLRQEAACRRWTIPQAVGMKHVLQSVGMARGLQSLAADPPCREVLRVARRVRSKHRSLPPPWSEPAPSGSGRGQDQPRSPCCSTMPARRPPLLSAPSGRDRARPATRSRIPARGVGRENDRSESTETEQTTAPADVMAIEVTTEDNAVAQLTAEDTAVAQLTAEDERGRPIDRRGERGRRSNGRRGRRRR